MGKPKKDKKSRRDIDSDSDGEESKTNLMMESEPAAEEPFAAAGKAAKKKKKTKGKKDIENDSDDDLDIVAKGGVSDDDMIHIKPVKNVKVKQKMSAFQMLDMLSDSDDQVASDSQEDIVVVQPKANKSKSKALKPEPVDDDVKEVYADDSDGVVDAPKPAKKAKDKKKKKKQKVEEEEDDIDAILAAMSYTNDPSAMEGGKRDSVDDVTEKLDSVALNNVEDAAEGEEESTSVKTKAQKKKEKREKDRQKKKEQKAKGADQKGKDEDVKEEKSAVAEKQEEGTNEQEEKEPTPEGDEGDADDTSSKKKKDRKKKKTKEEKEEEERAKRKPGKGKLKAMQEALAALKEQEEKLRKEEEEKERKAEELRLQKLEAERLEKEKKERAKQKKKEREQRLKEEGKWLTDKQKADRRRAMQMLEMMKKQGIEVPQKTDDQQPGEKKKRVVYEKKKKRPQPVKMEPGPSASPVPEAEAKEEEEEVDEKMDEAASEAQSESIADEAEVEEKEEIHEIKDDWDADSDDEKASVDDTRTEVKKTVEVTKPVEEVKAVVKEEVKEEEPEEEDDESSEEESESEEDESESESDIESNADLTQAERVRIRAQERIQTRQLQNEKARTPDVLRSPVVCVLGHVDTGKTKILDKLRRTHVQDGEAGGITQQIGATNVPVAAIQRQTEMCKEFTKNELRLPGLLIIDTPGHESFSNLRSRGSSLCDIAILVVDIMHGLEPQTIESIELLKKRKTPFVVALNKIDRLFQWKTNPNADIFNSLKKQQKHTKDEFDERVKNIILEFARQSLNVTLFYENKNPKEWISMVPTSAHTGDGMGNLMAAICEFSQTLLTKRLAYSEELQATVMEVKALPGLGTTIDVCLVNGRLREGQTIVVAGQEGPIVTQIRGLLIPPPMKELRVKNQYEKVKELKAAHGVKIIAKDLEKALAGLPLYACFHQDEVEIVREEVANQLKNALNSIKLSDRGVFVQASTLGSLEALLEFLKTSKIPYAGIGIGPVHKKDVMRASVMIEHDIQYAVILAFDVKVERDAQELADNLGVRIFTADIIYHLFDRFMEYREQYKQKKKDEFRHIAVFPCKMRILPQFIFNSRDPIVMGISVEGGVVKTGTPICVPSKEFVELGRITSLEINNKPIEFARKGQDVCIKIEPLPNEAPKMFGRHFEAEDMLVSSISRESIDAVKDYFRDEMQKTDWQLMIELKKIFRIP